MRGRLIAIGLYRFRFALGGASCVLALLVLGWFLNRHG
jgi:hypothetical protein